MRRRGRDVLRDAWAAPTAERKEHCVCRGRESKVNRGPALVVRSGALHTDSASCGVGVKKIIISPIQPPAKSKQDPATPPSAILDSHGCKKSKIALGGVAQQRGARSKTSGSLTPAIQF